MKSTRLTLALAAAATLWTMPLAAQEKLIIGTEAAYPPFAYVLPTGEMTGFDIDIANALCAEMKVECEISNQSYDGLIAALNSKKVDAIIASMFITEDRLKSIDFAGPYYVTPALFIGPEGTEADLSADGLSGKVIGVQRGTTMEAYVKAKFPDADVQFYDTFEAADLDLISGRVDLVFADLVVVDEFLASEDGAGFVVVGEPVFDTQYLGEGAGIGIRKGDAALKEKFDTALAALIASGAYKAINDKYMQTDIAPK